MSPNTPRSATSIALELPEILDLIASHILHTRQSTAACALVCKSWNEKFSAGLYDYLRLIGPRTTIRTGIIRHATHMRDLELFTDINTTLYPLPFNRLNSLTIQYRSNYKAVDYPPVISLVSDLVRQNNSTLQDITVCDMHFFAPTLWEAISTCSKLDQIRIDRSIAQGPDMDKVVDAIKLARVFDVIHASIDFNEVKPPLTPISPPRLPNLQYLDIFRPENFSGNIGPLVQHAPNLISLKLHPQLDSDPASHIRELAVSLSGCQKLQNLELYNMVLSSEDSNMIFNAVTNIKRLRWEVGGFSWRALGSLISRHSRTITLLYLYGSSELTSSMTQVIMTNCPLLEFLVLNTISGTDLARIEKIDQGNQIIGESLERVILGEDWICLGLKTLRLQFDLSSKTMDIDRDTPEGEAVFQRQQQLEQYHAFRQIGRLTLLQDLYISNQRSNTENERSLDLRLGTNGGGLEGLEALKELKRIEFNKTKQELSKEEIDWMVSQWPRLYSIRGTYHPVNAKDEDLTKYISEQQKSSSEYRSLGSIPFFFVQ